MTENTKPARILSIDALRGFDMFWITGGDAFSIAFFTFLGTPFFGKLALQLEHPAWAGFRFYDLIFPLFLFIVGLSIPFSITRRLERGSSKKDLYKHIIRRTIILYILGLIYNGLFNFDFETLRYTGVLHRIAFTYFFASVIVLNFKQKGQLAWALSITMVYWLILLFVPVPGFGAYNLTPQGNLGAFLDQKFLPGSFCCYQYGDNEGILTNFPAIVNVLVGVLAGYRLMKPEPTKTKIIFFVAAGTILIVAALLWNMIYPVNKYLWTGSYVSLTCGLSMLAMCLFYWVIDVKGYSKWAFPFTIIGMNCITIYVIQGIFDFGVIAKIFIHGFYTKMGAFQFPFYEFCVLTIKWLFLYFLYKQRLFLKV
jgi:predicted acyltransferase